MRRASSTLALGIVLTIALSLGTAQPAYATIDEIVASFCSGGNGNLQPPGQSDPTKRSFVRALQATGTIEIHVGMLPSGAPASPDHITVHLLATPANKFTPTNTYVVFPMDGALIHLQTGTPNSPAFEHCPKFTLPS